MANYALAASTEYAIVFRAPDAPGGADDIHIRHTTTGGYTGGAPFYSTDSGVSWGAYTATRDALFQEWGAVGSGSEGTRWTEGIKRHWIDENGDEQSSEGAATGVAGFTAHKGTSFVETTYHHGFDEEGDERRKEGTATGTTGFTALKGTSFTEGANRHYFDEEGDERYIEGD